MTAAKLHSRDDDVSDSLIEHHAALLPDQVLARHNDVPYIIMG